MFHIARLKYDYLIRQPQNNVLIHYSGMTESELVYLQSMPVR